MFSLKSVAKSALILAHKKFELYLSYAFIKWFEKARAKIKKIIDHDHRYLWRKWFWKNNTFKTYFN